MTTNPLVELLASYGPQSWSNNLYDEFVVATATRIGCRPIHIEQPIVDILKKNLLSESPKSVILTGTAGDGKTYTARNVLEDLSAGKKTWGATEKIVSHTFKNRKIRFIKDLSELKEHDKNRLFPFISASLTENTNNIFIICVNDGHLLKFFRDRRDENHGKYLYDEIETMLEHDRVLSSNKKFKIHNMSRDDHGSILNDIIDQVVDHSSWEKCKGCKLQEDATSPCPIQVNRDLLREKEDPSIRARMNDMIRIAAADGKYLSIRQLILLTVNILLGDSKDPEEAVLLNCDSSKSRAIMSEYQFTNPYSNIFGDNLQESQRRLYGVFTTLRGFGVGKESTNVIDQNIIWGKEEESANDIYGNRIFDEHRRIYQSDMNGATDDFFSAIVNQRRRLFFSTKVDSRYCSNESNQGPWCLTVFKYGAAHSHLASKENSGSFSELSEIRQKIILGLNRMMSENMTCTNDKLWIIESSGIYRGREIPRVVGYAEKGELADIRLCFKSPKDRSSSSRIVATVRDTDNPVTLELRPSVVECLIRVAHGALPSSSFDECQREVERFQHKMVAKIESRNGEGSALHLLEIGMEHGELRAYPAAILANQERW